MSSSPIQVIWPSEPSEQTISSLPKNVHVSTHPCLQAKLSNLRCELTSGRETKALIHEIGLILATEATATSLGTQRGSIDVTHIVAEYHTLEVKPTSIAIVPILRSGLALVDAMQAILPEPVPVNHLGLYREKATLTPVEYYNNFPYRKPDPSAMEEDTNSSAAEIAFLLDPVIATGGTVAAAIQLLREWGVKKVIVLAVLGATVGLKHAASEWPEATEIWVGGVDEEITDEGMISPGVGDMGDRLYLTKGKQ